jgi:hypothetical protein
VTEPGNVTAKRRNLAGRAAGGLHDARQARERAVCRTAGTRRDAVRHLSVPTCPGSPLAHGLMDP